MKLLKIFLPACIAMITSIYAAEGSQPNLLWHNSTTGAVKIMPINEMNPAPDFRVVDSSNVNLVPRGMGDFTGDGNPDILFHNQNSGNLRIWKMNGTTKVDNIQILGSSNTNLQIAGVGDFDGDGDNDIATFNTNSGALRIWVMDGTVRVGNVLVLTGANTNLVPSGVGDMDGDGIPDIVLRNSNSGKVRVWTMNSNFTRQDNVAVTSSSNTNLELRGVTDINGDGNNDILNYNTNTGKLRAWLMDGDLSITENAEITQDVDLEWSVRGGGEILFVKGVYINTDTSDDLIMTAVDANDMYYSYFGVKNESGELQHFTHIVMHQLNQTDELEHYLTVGFDLEQRPVRFSVTEGDVLLEYITDTQVNVSVKVAEDSFESDSVISSNTNKLLALAEESSASTQYTYIGNITTCRNNAAPDVTIERDLNETVKKVLPQFRFIAANITRVTDASRGEPDYFYSYKLNIPVEYPTWKTECQKDALWNVGVSIGGIFAEKAALIYTTLGNIWNDYKNGSTDNTKNQLVDTVADKWTHGIPIYSTLRQISEYTKSGADLHNGPCSEQVWSFLYNLQRVKQTITCTYRGEKKQASFLPPIKDPLNNAIDFDFSDSCYEGKVWKLVKTVKLGDHLYEKSSVDYKGDPCEIHDSHTASENTINYRFYHKGKGCRYHIDITGSIEFTVPPSYAYPNEEISLNLSGSIGGYKSGMMDGVGYTYFRPNSWIHVASSLSMTIANCGDVKEVSADGVTFQGRECSYTDTDSATYTFPGEYSNNFSIHGRGNHAVGWAWDYELVDR